MFRWTDRRLLSPVSPTGHPGYLKAPESDIIEIKGSNTSSHNDNDAQ